MKKTRLFPLLVSLLMAGLLLLSSCGSGVSDETLLAALEELAPRARELYGVVYGNDIPHGEEREDGYAQVSSAAAYHSIGELRAALRAVFSPEYASILENTAFSGVSTDEGSIAAKFIERGGVLFVNRSVTEDFAEPRSFDLSKAEVTKKNPYMAILRLPHEDGELSVTLRNIDGTWLLDSPMF